MTARRLLVLDDSEADQARVTRWLRGDKGWSVHRLAQPGSLMAELQRLQPQVLLLDYALPGVHGWQLLEDVRRAYPPSRLAVVLWTGEGDEAVATEGMRQGAQDYLVKGELTQISFRQALQRATHARDGAAALADRDAALRAANERLADANRALGRFATIAAHDLKSPLRRMALCSQILEQELSQTLSDEQRDMLTGIERDARRLRALIEQLLDLARAGDAMRPRALDLGVLFTKAGEAALRGVGEAIWEPAEPVWVDADPVLVGQVLDNLMVNAARYRASRPLRVTGRAVRHDGRWEISISDNGRGFPAEHNDTVFESFRRFHSDGQGSGLGLAIVRRVVERHGGTVSASGVVGVGATFAFSLPAAEPVSAR